MTSQISQIQKKLSSLNLIWKNFQHDQRNFFEHQRFFYFFFKNLNLNRIFFQLEKMTSRIFQIQINLYRLNLIWSNFQQDQRNFFDHEKLKISKLNRIFFQLEKMESRIFQIQIILSFLNLIWKNFEQDQRTFLSKKKCLLPKGILNKNFNSFKLNQIFFQFQNVLDKKPNYTYF